MRVSPLSTFIVLLLVKEMLLFVPKVNALVALNVPPFKTISASALPGVAPKLAEAEAAIVPAFILIAPVNDELLPDNVRVPAPCLTKVPFPDKVPDIVSFPPSPVVKVSVLGIENVPDPDEEPDSEPLDIFCDFQGCAFDFDFVFGADLF